MYSETYVCTYVCMYASLDVYHWEVNTQQLLVDMHIMHETGMHFCNGTCKDHPNANNTNMTCMCTYVRMCTYSTYKELLVMEHDPLPQLACICLPLRSAYVRMYCTVRTTYVHTYICTYVPMYVRMYTI